MNKPATVRLVGLLFTGVEEREIWVEGAGGDLPLGVCCSVSLTLGPVKNRRETRRERSPSNGRQKYTAA